MEKEEEYNTAEALLDKDEEYITQIELKAHMGGVTCEYFIPCLINFEKDDY